MPFDPIAAISGGVPNALPTQPAVTPIGDSTAAFSRLVANVSTGTGNTATPHASTRAQENRHEASRATAQVREYHQTSLPSNPHNAVGNHVLDRLETLHRGDQRLRMANLNAAPDQPAVALSGAGLQRGPAAGPLNANNKAADTFNIMLRNFEQVYQQSVQVGLMTKSTGAFTTSMNKLMSSA